MICWPVPAVTNSPAALSMAAHHGPRLIPRHRRGEWRTSRNALAPTMKHAAKARYTNAFQSMHDVLLVSDSGDVAAACGVAARRGNHRARGWQCGSGVAAPVDWAAASALPFVAAASESTCPPPGTGLPISVRSEDVPLVTSPGRRQRPNGSPLGCRCARSPARRRRDRLQDGADAHRRMAAQRPGPPGVHADVAGEVRAFAQAATAAVTAPPGPVAAGRALPRCVVGCAATRGGCPAGEPPRGARPGAQGSSTVPARVKKWSDLMALLKSGVLDPSSVRNFRWKRLPRLSE